MRRMYMEQLVIGTLSSFQTQNLSAYRIDQHEEELAALGPYLNRIYERTAFDCQLGGLDRAECKVRRPLRGNIGG